MIDKEILKMIENSFAPSAQTVYVNSLEKPVMFREARVREQKTISKIVIPNKDKLSVVYASTLSLIKLLCYDETLDVYSLTEFDRLKILSTIHSSNFFTKKVSFVCPKKDCKENFSFQIPYGDIIKGFEQVDTSDIIFENTTAYGKIKMWINFPSCLKYLSFLETIDCLKDEEERALLKKTEQKYSELNNLYGEVTAQNVSDSLIKKMFSKNKEPKQENTESKKTDEKKISITDIQDLYIQKIQYSLNNDFDEKGEQNVYTIDLRSYNIQDVEEILGMFPISFLTFPNGVSYTHFIKKSIEERLRCCLPKIVCPKCGFELSKYLSLKNFFIFG